VPGRGVEAAVEGGRRMIIRLSTRPSRFSLVDLKREHAVAKAPHVRRAVHARDALFGIKRTASAGFFALLRSPRWNPAPKPVNGDTLALKERMW